MSPPGASIFNKMEQSFYDSSSQGPERAPTTHEHQRLVTEEGQELAITVSMAHKKSLAPLSSWHKWLLGRCSGLRSPVGSRPGQGPSVSKSAQLESTG